MAKPYVDPASMSMDERIMHGEYPSWGKVDKFGHNPAVGVAFETVTDAGGLYPWPTSPFTPVVSSSAVADGASGAGARSVRFEGLDEEYEPLSEEVTLRGQESVTFENQFLRIFRGKVLTAGADGECAGDIVVRNGSDIVAQITARMNQTLMAVWTLHAGMKGHLDEFYLGNSSDKEITALLLMREHGSVFQAKRLMVLAAGTSLLPIRRGMDVPEKADLEIRARGKAPGGQVAAGFSLWWEPLNGPTE